MRLRAVPTRRALITETASVGHPFPKALVGSACVLLIAAFFALSAATSARAPGPTGDAQAIAFQWQVQQAYATVPGVKMIQRGYLFARRLRRNGYAYGHERLRHDVPATETFHYALSNGATTAYLVDVVARGVGRFSVIGNSSGVYDSDLGGGGCWQKTSAVYGPPGQDFITVDGHYYPLKHRGSLVLSRWSFPYGKGSKGTDVETIDPTTHYLLSARITVTGKQHLRTTQKFRTLSTAPTVPAPHVCS